MPFIVCFSVTGFYRAELHSHINSGHRWETQIGILSFLTCSRQKESAADTLLEIIHLGKVRKQSTQEGGSRYPLSCIFTGQLPLL